MLSLLCVSRWVVFSCYQLLFISVQYFDYVMNVLIPECVVRLIADVSKVSFTEVSKAFICMHAMF